MQFVKTIKRPIVFVPREIVQLIVAAHSALTDQSVEFGFYLSSFIRTDGNWEIRNPFEDGNFYTPRQTVSPGSISFDENPPDYKKFNAVVHRHPDGVKSFSLTDVESINAHFDVSFLAVMGPPVTFPDAVVNYRVGDNMFVQVPAAVRIIERVDPELLERIRLGMESAITRQPVPKPPKLFQPSPAGTIIAPQLSNAKPSPPLRAPIQRPTAFDVAGLEEDTSGFFG